jgi:CHAT domain-containing protein
LAEAFFDRGIENYIGAGWEVSDESAVKFARTFYQNTIEKGKSLGEALSEARMSISPYHTTNISQLDSTWGAYQHYGDPNTRLVGFMRGRNAEARKPKAKK